MSVCINQKAVFTAKLIAIRAFCQNLGQFTKYVNDKKEIID